MLKDILRDFKINALKELAGEDAVHFFESTLAITPDFYDENDQHDLLVEAILNSMPSALLSDKGKRDYFIERIPKKHLARIYSEQLARAVGEQEILPAHYLRLQELADSHFEKFLYLLDMEGTSVPDGKESNSNIEAYQQISPGYGLYPYQVEISEKTFKSIDFGDKKRAVIHLPTGAGKTRTAMHIVCRHLMTKPDALVLWLADSDILCRQAAEEFNTAWGFLGNRNILRGLFFKQNQFSLESITRGFVVAGVQKLHSYYKGLSEKSVTKFERQLTLVIFDEAHRSTATTYKELVDNFLENSPQAKLIGLTATPGRVYRDDYPELEPQNMALSKMFDNNKITMDVAPKQPMEYLIDNNYLASPIFKELVYNDADLFVDTEDRSLNENEILRRLGTSLNRNSEILKTTVNEVTQNNSKVIIFACDIEHARNLAFSLCCLGIQACSIDSKYTSQKEKELYIHAYKTGKINVIVNVEMLTTGFDAPETNVAIIGRPTNSLVLYLQMIGRAIRGNPDQSPKIATIYTVIDKLSNFNNINLAFRHWNNMWTELDTDEEV